MPTTPEARGQLLRFLIVGAGNTAIAYGLYALGLVLGLRFELASLFALLIGIVVSFVTQGRLVFMARLKGRFGLFLATWALLYCANIALIRLFGWAGLNDYLAGLAALVPVTALSFVIGRLVVFAEELPPLRVLVPAAILFLMGTARLQLSLIYPANWDEFLNLSMVHDHMRGDLREVLQTAFVHMFGWVRWISANELDQVIAARLLVLGFALATSLAIYGIARRFMDASAALVAVIAYNGFSFVVQHGNPLRTDPLAACLLTLATWLAVSRSWSWGRALLLGALVGLGGAMTIKAVFFVPTIGALLLLRVFATENRGAELARALGAGAAGLAAFLAVVGLHSLTFPDMASPGAFVERTSGELLFGWNYSVLLTWWRAALVGNFAFWLLLAAGLVGAAAMLRDPARRRDGLALLALAMPLLCVLIYRDVYPYFYAFMLPLPAVLAGLGFATLASRGDGRYARIALILLAALAALHHVQSLRQTSQGQRQAIDLVHRLFPGPVPYIDHTSMISAYPKQSFFMSAWGMKDYRRAGTPVMAKVIREKQPRFVLATRDLLDVERMDPLASERRENGLLAADVRALQASYRRYWGPLYLPGFAVEQSGTHRVEIAGRYRLQSGAAIRVDGLALKPGKTMRLSAGPHAFLLDAPAILVWDTPPPPASQPPKQLFQSL